MGADAERAATVLWPPAAPGGTRAEVGRARTRSLCAVQPDAPRSSREAVLKHSFLNPDADDLGFLFSEKIKCKYRLQVPRLIYQ